MAGLVHKLGSQVAFGSDVDMNLMQEAGKIEAAPGQLPNQ